MFHHQKETVFWKYLTLGLFLFFSHVRRGKKTDAIYLQYIPLDYCGNKVQRLLATALLLQWERWIGGVGGARRGGEGGAAAWLKRGREEKGEIVLDKGGHVCPQMLSVSLSLSLSHPTPTPTHHPPFECSMEAVFRGDAGRQSVMSCQQCSDGSLTYFRKYHWFLFITLLNSMYVQNTQSLFNLRCDHYYPTLSTECTATSIICILKKKKTTFIQQQQPVRPFHWSFVGKICC